MIKNSSIILNTQPYKECSSHEYGSCETNFQIALIAFSDSIASKTYRNTTAKQQNRTDYWNDVINWWPPVSIADFQVQVRSNEISENQSF